MGASPRRGPRRFSWFRQAPMLFPNEYVWLVLVSAMDIIFTWIIIRNEQGHEANPIAQFFITLFGSTGLIVFKFFIVVLVILICETVGRRQERTGRRLARASVIISALPLLVSLYLVIQNLGLLTSGQEF